jgi:hypothetical protein
MTPSSPPPAADLTLDLRSFRRLCGEALGLMTDESQALSEPNDYPAGEFNQRRKHLLPQLESALIRLRAHRQKGRQGLRTEEVKELFETIQSLLTKGLLLDRENQQALLRRGLVPPRHWPAAGAQQPHYVAGLYRQHSRRHEGGPA